MRHASMSSCLRRAISTALAMADAISSKCQLQAQAQAKHRACVTRAGRVRRATSSTQKFKAAHPTAPGTASASTVHAFVTMATEATSAVLYAALLAAYTAAQALVSVVRLVWKSVPFLGSDYSRRLRSAYVRA